MKYFNFKLFFLCLFFINIQANELSYYYGKTLYELKKENSEIKRIFSRSELIIRIKSFFNSLSTKKRKRIEQDINILKEIIPHIDKDIEIIKQIIDKHHKENSNSKGTDRIDPLVEVAVTVLLAPWMILGDALSSHYINEKKDQLETMLTTRKSIQEKINKLERLLEDL